MIDVACVGILVADAIAKPVVKIPQKGKLELVENLSLFSGGCAASTAIDIAKIGLKSAIVGKIGNDGFGKFMQNSLNEQGVNTEALMVDNNSSTSASLVIVSKDSERSFIHCQGANANFVESDINYDIIKKSGIIFVAGVMLMEKFDGAQCAKFLKKCKELKKPTALDVAWDSTGRWMNVLEQSMSYIDYFLPSIEEAVELSGKKEPEEIADYFLSMGPSVVVIKMGQDGCYIKSKNGESRTVPIYKVSPIDTTGAGDSFCAGFLSALCRGKSLYECGKFANAVGAHCVMAQGASTGIKSEAEILQFMEEYK